jgi:hypothetical protein
MKNVLFNIYAEYNDDDFWSICFSSEFRSLTAVYQVENIKSTGIENLNVKTLMNVSFW